MSEVAKITYNKLTGELLAYLRCGRSDVFGSQKSLRAVGPEQLALIYKQSLKNYWILKNKKLVGIYIKISDSLFFFDYPCFFIC